MFDSESDLPHRSELNHGRKAKGGASNSADGGAMIPGIPGGRMNPRQLKMAMKRMGVETEELSDVEEVVIRTSSKEYVFRSAQVTAMTVQGQRTWQIAGEPLVLNRKTEGIPVQKPSISEEDIDLVAEKAGVSKDVARKALEEANGEPAEAIIRLMSR